MADTLYQFTSQAGVRRDGTNLDSPFHQDGQWVRFQRGKPRKIGGYQSMTQQANGPVRSIVMDSRGGVTSTHLFSQWGVQRVQFGATGASSIIEDRTPSGFAVNPNLTWSHDSMYSSTGGAYSAIIAASSPDLLDISSDTAGGIYAGNIQTNDPLVQIANGSGPITTSGGICVLQPFLVVYGSNGLIVNSNANDYSTATGWVQGGSNLSVSNNVAGTKIVYGQAIRGGSSSPAGLFWSMDSLIRMSFVGGTGYWNYDTLADPITVLAKKAIVEHDGKFFWPGVDRFYFYNGVVQELQNDMNSNYFFDNLNFAYQNKVWGVKLARYSEIWWFYPRGTDTECGNAIIFNYKENTWYDAVCKRTAGATPTSNFRFPVWAGHEDTFDTQLLNTGLRLTTSALTASASAVLNFTSTTGVVAGMVVSGSVGIPYGTTVLSFTGTTVTLSATTTGVAAGAVLSFTSMTRAFVVGNTVTGGTSGATGIARRVLTNSLNVSDVTNGPFVSGEALTGIASAVATLQSAPVYQQLVTQYQQEYQWDKVVGQVASSIQSSFTSQNFGFAVGSPFSDVPKTMDVMTRLQRVEPDFNQTGDMTLNVIGRDFAKSPSVVTNSYTMANSAPLQDMTDQARIINLQVVSNTLGGFYEQGQVMLKLEPGDERSATS